MLSLQRREGESILLDTPAGRIRICVTHYRARRVRVHIDAPKEVTILREEIAGDQPDTSSSE